MTTTPAAVAHIDHYIDGRVDDRGAETRSEVYSPATGQVSGLLALATTRDVDAAVQSAATAFETWSLTPPHIRARILFRFRDLVERETDRLAAIITAEHGKVLDDARGEVTRGLEVVARAGSTSTPSVRATSTRWWFLNADRR